MVPRPAPRVAELDTPDRDLSRPLSTKVVQLTGQSDHQWEIPAHNRTEERFELRGTDLGASFRHRQRTYFLFGDTHWTKPLQGTLDSIAYTTDVSAAGGLSLEFHRAYPEIVNPGVSRTNTTSRSTASASRIGCSPSSPPITSSTAR